jgi:hypothetical protein
MSDFALCQNNQCPSSNSCLRFLGKSNDEQQVYAIFQPDDKDECEYFIEEIDEPSVSVWKTWDEDM